MKVLHVCFSDANGGAAIGAYRLHTTMLNSGIDSSLLVVNKYTEDPTVIKLPKDKFRVAKNKINKLVLSLYGTNNSIFHSLNIFGRGAAKIINSFDADVVQLHWVNLDTVSISDIKRINKPLVWKLPDMWAFSGAEHYLLPDDPLRYKDGYKSKNRPSHERGFDLNKYIWMYKYASWKKSKFSIVCPSKWLKACAEDSLLFKGRPICNIPNPIDLNKYAPKDKIECRKYFGMPVMKDKKLFLFGALASLSDKRKGFHYLVNALEYLQDLGLQDELALAVLGNNSDLEDKIRGVSVINLGRINNQEDMIKAYNAADFHVFPTQADNLPNVVKEASACGLPCVGFNVGGMPDMVKHMETGYLADPYNTRQLANGIKWMMEQDLDELAGKARLYAEKLHNPKDCVERYMKVYMQAIKGQQDNSELSRSIT